MTEGKCGSTLKAMRLNKENLHKYFDGTDSEYKYPKSTRNYVKSCKGDCNKLINTGNF